MPTPNEKLAESLDALSALAGVASAERRGEVVVLSCSDSDEATKKTKKAIVKKSTDSVVKVALLGFGTVGSSVARVLAFWRGSP